MQPIQILLIKNVKMMLLALKEINLVEYPTVEDCLKQVVCKHHIPEIMIMTVVKIQVQIPITIQIQIPIQIQIQIQIQIPILIP